MKKVEAHVKKLRRRNNLKHALLTAVQAGGVVAVAVLAPNALQLLKYTEIGKRQARYRLKTAFSRALHDGYLELVYSKKGKKSVQLTRKGRLHLIEKGSGLRAPKRWDKRWRIVAFDIPEKRKGTRDRIRTFLKNAGFHRLQDSLWIYPYECEEVVEMIKIDFGIRNGLVYIVAEGIEREEELKSRFNL